MGVEHFSYVKNVFYSNTFSLMMWTCEWKCSIGQFFWIARIYTRHRGWEVKQKKWGIDLFNLNAISFVFSLQTLHPRKNFNNIRQHSHWTPAHCNTEFYIHLRFNFLLQKTSLFYKNIYIQIVRMSKLPEFFKREQEAIKYVSKNIKSRFDSTQGRFRFRFPSHFSHFLQIAVYLTLLLFL